MAMNRNFPTLSQSELEEELKAIEKEILQGKTRTSTSAGDLSQTSQITVSPIKRKQMVLSDLHELDPDNYSSPVKWVRPQYK